MRQHLNFWFGGAQPWCSAIFVTREERLLKRIIPTISVGSAEKMGCQMDPKVLYPYHVLSSVLELIARTDEAQKVHPT